VVKEFIGEYLVPGSRPTVPSMMPILPADGGRRVYGHQPPAHAHRPLTGLGRTPFPRTARSWRRRRAGSMYAVLPALAAARVRLSDRPGKTFGSEQVSMS